jgi:copper transport protein
MSRHLIWRSILIAALGAALLIQAAPVSAHAIIVSSDPADGAVLDVSPTQIRLWFSEPILLDFTTVELTGSDGQLIEVDGVRLDEADPKALIVDIPPLPPNAYRLTYRTLSTEDIHPSNGSIVFGIQQAADIAPAVIATAPSPLEVALRWLNFGAMATLAGGLVIALGVLPSGNSDPESIQAHAASRRRLLRLALWSSVLALIAGAGLLWVQVRQASGAADSTAILNGTWQILSATDYGERWIRRVVLLFVIAAAILWLNRRKRQRTRLVELLAMTPLLLALIFIQSLSSHAAGLENTSLLKVGLDALHLLAASLWVGGVLALVVVMAPLLRRGGAESALARGAFSRFGGLAALSVAVIFATGIYNSGQQVASLDALLVTLYGQSLMLKVGLVLCVGLIGLLNSALLHPGVADLLRRLLRRPEGWLPLAPNRLGRAVLLESVGAAGVLLMAALLSATTPARGPEFEPPSKEELSARASFTSKADDLLVTFSIKPNRPGQNFISLGVFNTRRPAPAPIDLVEVRLTPPGGQEVVLTAELLEEGKYQIVGDTINAGGDWQVNIRVVRPGLADSTLSTLWTVLPLQRNTVRRPVLLSNQPLASTLTPLAVVFAIIAGIALAGIYVFNLRRQGKEGDTDFRR